jgi:hypothetical protein
MKKIIALSAPLTLAAGMAAATPWTTYNLPDTTAGFNTWALGHTSGGEFIYAENGIVYRQNSFGNDAYTQYSNSPVSGADPSFIATGSSTSGVIGKGGWGASALASFDPSNTASTFTDTSYTLSNFAGEMRDASSLYIAGANGTGGSNNIVYVTLDGTVNQTLIADVSEYSAGIALDNSGNLYVGDNDDGKIYKFTSVQLSDAITAATALEISDGTYVCDFGSGGNIGSLAVDANDVLWGAGWAAAGIQSYDPSTDSFYAWKPGYDTTHYIVDTFAQNGTNYVAFASASGSSSGSSVIYGFADTQAVPEPASVLLILLGSMGIAGYRRYSAHLRS